MTASGTWLDRLSRTSFVRVRITDGVALDGATPSSEVGLHLAVYRARPDVNAVVHLHPQTAVLLEALGVPIRLMTTDHAFYLRRVAVTAWHAPGTPEVGEAVAAAVADGTNCVLLPFHGCAVLGDTVEMAHRRAVNLEEAARLTYQAVSLVGDRALPECPPEFLAGRDAGSLI
ncbi:aldolase [Luedemannella helvata]|uniref:Aldolase n=1 Tax=Luedemannella helvata TaxID=349315 RepID=A0ABN2K4C6_9ACTN